jgi:hypothetical protein
MTGRRYLAPSDDQVTRARAKPPRDAGLLPALHALDLVAHKVLDHAGQIVVEPCPEHLTHHVFERRGMLHRNLHTTQGGAHYS